MKKIVSILIMTLLIATSLSVMGHINEKEPELIVVFNNPNIGYHNGYSSTINEGTVLWDNGMHYYNYFGSQWDPEYPLDIINADDFQFEETTIITSVNWIGGYFNPCEDGDFDWNVSFYTDGVDGDIPGEIIYKEIFLNEDVHETYVGFFEGPEEIYNSYIFSYTVNLAEPISFNAGEKYWLSIQGLGAFPPQTHWALHIPAIEHNIFIKSNYFDWPEWTDITETIVGTPCDACFQLLGEGTPVEADLEGGGNLNWEVKAGSTINGTVSIRNDGDVGSMLEWEIQSVPQNWGTNWTVRWSINETTAPFEGGFVGATNPETIFVQVKAPDEKNKEFTGEIVLVNSDNPDDTCIINVVCKTPKSRELNQFHLLIEKLCERFMILRYLL